MSSILRFILICHICLIAGCATLAKQKQLDSLEASLRTYEMAIRWSQYEVAKEFIQNIERQAQLFKKFSTIKVTSYEVLSLKVSIDDLQAEQKVEIKYYDPSHMIENTLVDIQSWKYNEEEKRWYLQSDFPDFK
jgi:hypothetical protein